MKRLVIAVLAIGAMAACTKSNVQYEQSGEISLQPVTQKATKSAVDGTYYPTETAYNFNVWAWWGEGDPGTGLDEFITPSPTDYISEGTFTARNNVSWGGVTPYYWPTKGSLVFAGYSPASAKVEGQDAPVFHYDLPTKTFSVSNYTQSNNIAATKDLMWFDATNVSYDQNGAENKGVPVQFKHALSWLTFKFNLLSAATAEMWTITDVKLTGIEDNATFTAVKDDTPEWSTAAKSAEGMDVVNVYNAGEGTGYTVAYVNGGTVLPNTDVVFEGTNVLNNAVLVIPQSCATGDAKLVITYKMKTYVDGVDPIDQEVTLPLNGSQITDNKWLPGKHYIYTITFGANEILIAPTVQDWDDVHVGEDNNDATDDDNDDNPEITD